MQKHEEKERRDNLIVEDPAIRLKDDKGRVVSGSCGRCSNRPLGAYRNDGPLLNCLEILKWPLLLSGFFIDLLLLLWALWCIGPLGISTQLWVLVLLVKEDKRQALISWVQGWEIPFRRSRKAIDWLRIEKELRKTKHAPP